jgi:SAM-dependent methyltransferase
VTGAAGYTGRARHYAAEIAGIPEPRLLAGLLRTRLRAAELPSATGHFLHAYAAAGAEVTLIDACPEMLRAAREQASILPLQPPRTVLCRIQDLTPQIGPIDLAVIPNAALNQLTADIDPAEMLTAAARILAPIGLLLAQVLLLDDNGTAAGCGFYDPAAADGAWLTDRQLTAGDGRQLFRRRRQHRDGSRLHIDFELTAAGEPPRAHRVDLRLLTASGIETAAATAGLTLLSARPGNGGLHEILIARADGSPQ